MFLLSSGFGAGSVAAQQLQDVVDGARARVDVVAGATTLAGSAVLFVGGGALVGLGDRLWLGGVGVVSSSVHYTASDRAGPSVGIGYGGLIVELEVLDWHGGSLAASALVGGGNADARDAVVGAELGSDNFLVLHPVLRFRRPLRPPFEVGVEAGYRYALGVEDLPGLDRGDLSGPTLAVSMHAIRR